MSSTECDEKISLFLFLCLIVPELRLIMDACLLTSIYPFPLEHLLVASDM